MGNSRRYDLKPGIGVAVVAVVLLFADKIDGITFVAFLFIGVCGTVGATFRKRADNSHSHRD